MKAKKSQAKAKTLKTRAAKKAPEATESHAAIEAERHLANCSYRVAMNTPSFLNDKVAWVTGSSRGIGRVVADHLASLGARVVVHGTSPTSTRAFDEADSLKVGFGNQHSYPRALHLADGRRQLLAKPGGQALEGLVEQQQLGGAHQRAC